MKCDTLLDCVNVFLQGSLPGFIYQSHINYALPLLTLLGLLFFLALLWQRSVGSRSEERLGWILLSAAMIVGWLLTIPAYLFYYRPDYLLTLLGIPTDVSIYNLYPEVMQSAASVLKGFGWIALWGTALQGAAFVVSESGQSSVTNVPFPVTSPARVLNPTPSPISRNLEIREVTPVRDASPQSGEDSRSGSKYQVRGSDDGDRTLIPDHETSEPYNPPANRVAWIELEWVNERRPHDNSLRWRLDNQEYAVEVGRSTSNEKRLDNRVILPDAPQTISRQQAIIGAEMERGYYIKNMGQSTMRIDGRTIANNSHDEVALHDGSKIKIGHFEFVFHEIGVPVLQVNNSIDSISSGPSHVQVMGSRFTLGGTGSRIHLERQNPVANVYFDIAYSPPCYVLEPLTVTDDAFAIDDESVGEEDVASRKRFPLQANSIVEIGGWQITFQVNQF